MLITTAQRRARLVERHYLTGSAPDVETAVAGVVALHSSDPISPYLSVGARVAGFTVADLDRALFADRTLWRLHAMRRTLFVVPAGQAAMFDVAAGRAIAERERTRLVKWLRADLSGRAAASLLDDAEAAVIEELAGQGELRTAELSERVPALQQTLTVGSGTWTSETPLSSRLLYVMAMEGTIVRTRPAGSWRSSQYHWALASDWFGGLPEPPADGAAALAQRYLERFGPATEHDLRWWAGWGAGATRAALAAAGAVAVELDDGVEAFVAPDDATSPGGVEGDTVAFLPGLDPTPMGWKQRHWYLDDELVPDVFDRNGNVGPTVWWNGRIVGGWGQRPSGVVAFEILTEVPRHVASLVEARAEELTGWFGGEHVTPRFRTPLERRLSALD
ncbi:MAG: winged helix DNA-binding domain-containing protein [Acidimicrobiia bacterium]|nr:winged helix DNA-binding domain-containing protein [Acidimicrobiia bacterium]